MSLIIVISQWSRGHAPADWTLFALVAGKVNFAKNGKRVNIVPEAAPAQN